MIVNDGRVADDGVGIRGDGDATDRLGAFDETGVGGFEQFGQRGAGHGVAAVQADHLGVGAVQVDDVAAAGLGVQQIDVLGDDARHHTGALERRQCTVTGIRQRVVHVPPAHVITRPVALPEHRVGGELPDGHRIARRRVRSAVVGNPRIGGHPRAGEHRHPASLQQGDEFGGFHPIEGRRSGVLVVLRLILALRPGQPGRRSPSSAESSSSKSSSSSSSSSRGAISNTSTCFSAGSASDSGTETVRMPRS